MNCRFSIIFFFLVFVSGIYSQGVFTISTNKSEYSYGEVIEVTVSIFNNTDSTIIFHPECEYPVWVRVKGVEFLEMHSLADGCERYLQPRECETWNFQLDPSKLGFPISNGEQVIFGSGYNHLDSVKITAPKYYGGIIEVIYNYLLKKDERDKYFNDLSATVIKTDTIKGQQQIRELWSIRNKDIDSLENAYYRNRNIFGYIYTFRLFEQGTRTITSVNNRVEIPQNYLLFQNYPNPFNPSTTISYQLPFAGYVTLKVYDILGRKVATLVDEFQNVGTYQIIFNGRRTIDNGQLSGGIYLYTIRVRDSSLNASKNSASGSEYCETKKMLLLK